MATGARAAAPCVGKVLETTGNVFATVACVDARRTSRNGGIPGVRPFGSLEELSARWPFGSGLVMVTASDVDPVGDEWPWEAVGLRDLHGEIGLVAGRVLGRGGRVVGGPRRLVGGVAEDVYNGLPWNQGGSYARALKQQSVDGVDHRFFAADARLLRDVLGDGAGERNQERLAGELARRSREAGRRVAFSPLISAVLADGAETVRS